MSEEKKTSSFIGIGKILDKVTMGKKCKEEYLTSRNKRTRVQNLVKAIEGKL